MEIFPFFLFARLDKKKDFREYELFYDERISVFFFFYRFMIKWRESSSIDISWLLCSNEMDEIYECVISFLFFFSFFYFAIRVLERVLQRFAISSPRNDKWNHLNDNFFFDLTESEVVLKILFFPFRDNSIIITIHRHCWSGSEKIHSRQSHIRFMKWSFNIFTVNLRKSWRKFFWNHLQKTSFFIFWRENTNRYGN